MRETLGTPVIHGFIVSYDVRTVKYIYISSEESSSSSNYFLDNDIGMDGWADMIYLKS